MLKGFLTAFVISLCTYNVFNNGSFSKASLSQPTIDDTMKLSDGETIGCESDFINWIGRNEYLEEDNTTWFTYSLSGFCIHSICTSLSVDLSWKTVDVEQWVPYLAVIIDEDYDQIKYFSFEENSSGEKNVNVANGLEYVQHSFRFLKKSEAGYTALGLRSITTDGTFVASSEKSKLSVMFISDHLGFGDYTEKTGDEKESLSSSNSNPFNAFCFLTARSLEADYSFIGARAFAVYKSRYIDEDFKLQTFGEIIDSSNYYVDTTIDNITKWPKEAFVPDVVVLNVGFSDHSYYMTLNKNERPTFLVAFKNAYVNLINHIKNDYPEAKIVMMSGMTFLHDDIVDAINSVCALYENNVYRLVSKARSVREDMILNMPTLNMHKYAASELTNEIQIILGLKPRNTFSAYSIISGCSLAVISIVIPLIYIFVDKRFRRNRQ